MNPYFKFMLEASESVKSKIRKLPRTDYCAVYSFAHIANKTVEEVWPDLEPYFGKKNKFNGKGMNLLTLITIARQLGYEVNVDPKYSNIDGVKDRTWGSIKDKIVQEKKPYLVMVLGHAIGVGHGSFIDTGRTKDSEKIMVSMSMSKKRVLTRKKSV